MAKQTGIKKESKTEAARGKQDNYALKVLPYLQDIKNYASHGVTEGQLCEYYGVGKTAWAAYKKKYPELTETLSHTREVCKTELINVGYKAAIGYEYTETTQVDYKNAEGAITGSKTTTVTRYAKPDGGLIQFLLINRYPDEYARDPQVLDLRRELLELKKKLSGDGGDGGEMEGI